MNPALLALLGARVAAGGWTPATLGAGLVAWYDASNAASITTEAGRVTGWADLSGNARHAAFTGTAAALPVMGTLNGSPAITWSGVSGQATGGVTIPTVTDVTVAIVWQWEAAGHRSAAYGGALNHPELLQESAGSSVWRVQASRVVTLGAGGAPHCTRSYFRDNADGAVFHDGVDIAVVSAFPLAGSSIKSIGRAERAAISLKGSVAEMVVASGNVPELDAYLMTKWRIA